MPPDESMWRAVRAQRGSGDLVAIVDTVYRERIGAFPFGCPQVACLAIAPDVDMRCAVGIVGCQRYRAFVVQVSSLHVGRGGERDGSYPVLRRGGLGKSHSPCQKGEQQESRFALHDSLPFLVYANARNNGQWPRPG